MMLKTDENSSNTPQAINITDDISAAISADNSSGISADMNIADNISSSAPKTVANTQANLEPAQVLTPLLQTIKKPSDLAAIQVADLPELAKEVRSLIIKTVSNNGGHLAPSLGVVELSIALLKSFQLPHDKLIWDVGHQSYAHKILTGRAESFHTIRKLHGLSGFPKICESPFDHFGVGHSSTSISAGLGFAMGRDLACKSHHVVSVIGDGALTAGLAFEGLNQAGHMGKKLIVVLNDNEMSISKNVGALSLFLSSNLSRPWVRKVKKDIRSALNSIPAIGEDLVNFAIKSQHGLKTVFTPGMLFEALNFKYVGPVDGHDIQALCDVFELAKEIEKPVLIHVLTTKGKGYLPAEVDPSHFHGVGQFKIEKKVEASNVCVSFESDLIEAAENAEESAEAEESAVAAEQNNPNNQNISNNSDNLNNSESNEPNLASSLPLAVPQNSLAPKTPSYTDVFSRTICQIAEKNKRIVAITAAMPEGTGLAAFATQFPERFVDVGICEQHAVTFAAGLALEGLHPVIAVYSTFLQRAYDQVVHDVCLQNLPVTFCLDRAGLVGEDGPTHHGVFDLSYLRHIPNLTIISPKDEAELQEALAYALQHNGPVALRYPRGKGLGVRLHPEPYTLKTLPSLDYGVELLELSANADLDQSNVSANASASAVQPALKPAQPSTMAVLALGNMVRPSFRAAQEILDEQNIQISVYNMRWVKPLPLADILAIAKKYNKLLIVEENALAGGFSSGILELLADHDCLADKKIVRLGIKDKFVEHGSSEQLRKILGLDRAGIKTSILELLDL